MAAKPSSTSLVNRRIKIGMLPLRAASLRHAAIYRHIENWAEFDLCVLRNMGEVQLKARRFRKPLLVFFRNQTGPLALENVDEAFFLAESLHFGTALGIEHPVTEAVFLLGEMRDVTCRLREKFTRAEVKRWATGGAPSPKEIVLYFLVRILQPDIVVETGVAQGVSSRFILQALQRNERGRLLSIDVPNYDPGGYDYKDEHGTHDGVFVRSELGTGWLVPSSLRGRWTLKLQPSSRVLPEITGRVDAFYHDSEHSLSNMTFELSWAVRHVRPGGFIASDDVNWNTAWRDIVRTHRSNLECWSSTRFGLACVL